MFVRWMRSNYSDNVSIEYMMIATSIIISFHVSLYLLLNVCFLVVTDDLYFQFLNHCYDCLSDGRKPTTLTKG